MTKFNLKQTNKTKTYEGGDAYEKSDTELLFDFLFGSLLEDGFYETADERVRTLDKLLGNAIEDRGPEFVAKLAIFARDELGMRSVSQYAAAKLNDQQFNWKRDFYRAFCHRPDDMSEIMAILDGKLHQKRSHALVRGFGDYLSSLDGYKLAKYKMAGKAYNMYDLVNITHATSAPIDAFMRGELAPADTWENNISNASADERASKWVEMVDGRKLGYMALIRNLNNILGAAADKGLDGSWVDDVLVPQITNGDAIKRSLAFPYRIYTAYKNLKVRNTSVVRALDVAFSKATENMPELDGSTAIVVDVSGSMHAPISERSDISILEASACYAVALYMRNPDCQVVRFADRAKEVRLNRLCGPFDMIKMVSANDGLGYGTHLNSAFDILSDHDHVFVFSDMQTMRGNGYWFTGDERSVTTCVKEYLDRNPSTHIFSFDLGSYNSIPFNPNKANVHCMTCLNDKLFEYVGLMEKSDEFLCDYIDSHYSF